MKRIYVIVEGQTEEEFVKSLLQDYFLQKGVFIIPLIVRTSKKDKGGFVNYQHLVNTAKNVVFEPGVIVTMFVDYFMLPTDIPDYRECLAKHNGIDQRIECLQEAIKAQLGWPNFVPYIQKHEFEALLFADNAGFQKYFSANSTQTEAIIQEFPDPEEINSGQNTAPSKRLLALLPSYQKIADGNIVALEIGLERIMNKCPRFRNWVETLIERAKIS